MDIRVFRVFRCSRTWQAIIVKFVLTSLGMVQIERQERFVGLFCKYAKKRIAFIGKMTIFASERNRQSKYMASNSDFVQYIADQCAGAGEIKVRKMFGDYGIYCDGKIFGLVCDDHFYVKPTEAGRAVLRTVDLRPPYDGAKDYFYIADVDDHEYLSLLVRETCKALPMPKPKRK